jgi:hypothetical protein
MRGRGGGPEPLDATVRRELDRLGGGPPGAAGIGAIVEVWPQAVGEAIARNAWPARIARDGTLVVHAASSAWAFELSQLEGEVRAGLGDRAPARIKFVVGPVLEQAPEAPQSVTKERRSIPEPTPSQARLAAEIAAEIDDSALRELVARAAAAALARSAGPAVTTDPSDTIRST